MKLSKPLKITGIILLSIIGIIVLLVLYVRLFLPNIPLKKDLQVQITPERLERGKYLANHVMVCIDCHSTRDWSKFSGPVVAGSEGKGGEIFDQKMGFPGKYISPNITPYATKSYTDAELYRAITAGVGKDRKPLFPVMPYHSYGSMDDEDIFSIIAYIRSLPEVSYDPPQSKSDFPMNLIIRMIPKEGVPGNLPDTANPVEYGKYLTNAAACTDCHTPFEKGKPVVEEAFSGGREFPMPFGTLTAPNITPDVNTGIGGWTREVFINRFKAYDPVTYNPHNVASSEFNTIMPWTMYAGMSARDLGFIYDYLKTLKPIEKKITKIKN